jgi:SSS family solute:Na+ symporter
MFKFNKHGVGAAFVLAFGLSGRALSSLRSLLDGTWLVWSDGLQPLHTVLFGSTAFSLYVGLLALAINIAVAVVANASLMLGRYHNHVLRSFCRQRRVRS